MRGYLEGSIPPKPCFSRERSRRNERYASLSEELSCEGLLRHRCGGGGLVVHVVVCVCGCASVFNARCAASAGGVTAARRGGSVYACGAEPDCAAGAEQSAGCGRALECGSDAARHAGEHGERLAGAADVVQS